MRLVAATVDASDQGLNPEPSVVHCPIPGERRGAALDVEPVVSRPLGDVALQQAMAVLLSDQESILAAVFDQVAADDVVGTADERMPDAEADACPGSADDDLLGRPGSGAPLHPGALP